MEELKNISKERNQACI